MIGNIARANNPLTPTPAAPPSGDAAKTKQSGIAHLMSALHQNAAAVVNSKTQLNGPDQVRGFKK